MRAIEGPPVDWKAGQVTTTTTAEALSATTPKTMAMAVITEEKLIGDNNLRPIAFLEQGLRVAKSVAQVVVPGLGVGTGFMISPNILITNHHVIPTLDDAAVSVARFNYEADIAGALLASVYFRAVPDQLFVTDEARDFTLVALDGDPGLRFGFVPVTPIDPAVGDAVNIIQHPNGQPKQIALVDNQIAYVGDGVVQYLTDTLPGSSGSPVFDDQWRLVALHHSGGWIPEPSNGSTHFRNEGIAVNALIEAFRSVGLVTEYASSAAGATLAGPPAAAGPGREVAYAAGVGPSELAYSGVGGGSMAHSRPQRSSGDRKGRRPRS